MKNEAFAPFEEIAAPVPHAIDTLLPALNAAMKSILTADAVYEPVENVFAVLDEESFVHAYAFLCTGLARYISRPTLSAEEREEQILFHLDGALRVPGRVPTLRDLLPEREDCRARLAAALRINGMAYTLQADASRATLSVSLPRFLTRSYVAGGFDAESVSRDFLFAVCLLSGSPLSKKPAPVGAPA